jgi:hypothetical protein
MSLAAHVAEDGLAGHHWEERPLGDSLYAPVQGNARAKKWEWVNWGEGEGMGDFWDSIGNVNEENT